MNEETCVPFAPALAESMRSLGYSFSTAIADLLDNSISAQAKNIEIISESSSDPSLIVLDDGCGMTLEKLKEAMRYGSKDPRVVREENDLGRFGLGMKSASLSQCRKLVVISKKDGKLSGYAWDLDYLVQTGKWSLKRFNQNEINEFEEINRLKILEHGTYILLRKFDKIKAGTNDLSKTFTKCLDDMDNHLALVFHRFIDEGLNIKINNRKLKRQDPFLTDNKSTQKGRTTSFSIKSEKIILKPYILPHMSKLSKTDKELLGGIDELKKNQGFYIYRNKRLIIWGTWFRLGNKEELNKLARVMVDIPNSLDYMWSIDIKKSTARLPDMIKDKMRSAVIKSICISEKIHTYRGRKERNSDSDYIWERIEKRDGAKYVINRDLPQFKLLEETLDKSQLKLLNSAIGVIEEAFPVHALYLDAAKGDVAKLNTIEKDEEVEKLWDDLKNQLEYIKDNNLSIDAYCKAYMKIEPYSRSEVIKSRLKRMVESNEFIKQI